MYVTIISGPKNSAKTTTLKNIVNKREKEYLGYLCESLNNKNNLFLRDLNTNETINLMQTTPCLHKDKVGKYFVHLNAFEKASTMLLKQIENSKNEDIVIVLDEVGYLELLDSGFDDLIKVLIYLNKDLLICIRDEFVKRVISKYRFENYKINNI